jgi:hypothetical protein
VVLKPLLAATLKMNFIDTRAQLHDKPPVPSPADEFLSFEGIGDFTGAIIVFP